MYIRSEGADTARAKGLGYLWIAAQAGDGLAQCLLGTVVLNDLLDISDRLNGLMSLEIATKTGKQCAKLALQTSTVANSTTLDYYMVILLFESHVKPK